MTDEAVLTKAITEEFLADPRDVDLAMFTTIEDAAAEILSKHNGNLSLDGLTNLSDAAAESLGRLEGSSYSLSLNNLIKEQVEKFQKDGLDLRGLTMSKLNLHDKQSLIRIWSETKVLLEDLDSTANRRIPGTFTCKPCLDFPNKKNFPLDFQVFMEIIGPMTTGFGDVLGVEICKAVDSDSNDFEDIFNDLPDSSIGVAIDCHLNDFYFLTTKIPYEFEGSEITPLVFRPGMNFSQWFFIQIGSELDYYGHADYANRLYAISGIK